MGSPLITRQALERAAPVGPQLLRILRDRIVRNELAPGTRLSESEIAGEYEISRQPVREAFIKLADEGLLEVRPQRGTFVRKISVDAVMDARFVREAIEADIVKLLAAKPNRTLIRDLKAQLDAQRQVAAEDPLLFIQLDEQFHQMLAEGAGKSYARSVVNSVKAQMDRVRHLSARRFPKDILIVQHAAIVDAIARGDAVAAEQAMRTHLRAIITDLPAIARANPDFFEGATDATLE